MDWLNIGYYLGKWLVENPIISVPVTILMLAYQLRSVYQMFRGKPDDG